MRDHGRFVGLGVRAQAHPGPVQHRRHTVQVGLERRQLDDQRRRIDLVQLHAGLGGRRLNHAYRHGLKNELRRYSGTWYEITAASVPGLRFVMPAFDVCPNDATSREPSSNT